MVVSGHTALDELSFALEDDLKGWRPGMLEKDAFEHYTERLISQRARSSMTKQLENTMRRSILIADMVTTVAEAGESEAWRRSPLDDYEAYLDEYLVLGNFAQRARKVCRALEELMLLFDDGEFTLQTAYESGELLWQSM